MSLKNYRLFNVKRIVALMLVIVFSFQSMVINTERIGYEFYMQRKKEKEGIK